MLGDGAATPAAPAPVAPIRRRPSDDGVIHRFYCLWDKPAPDGTFVDQADQSTHGYKWLPGTRDEALYKDSTRVTGWRMRNLYEEIPGAVKAPEDPSAEVETEGEVVTSLGEAWANTEVSSKDTFSGKGKTENVVAEKKDEKPKKKPEDEGREVEAEVEVVSGSLKTDALELFGAKFKASGEGSLSVGTGGITGAGEFAAETSSSTGASKGTVVLQGVETVTKKSASSKKTAIKGEVEGDRTGPSEGSIEAVTTSAGASTASTSTYASGATTSSGSAEQARTQKGSAKFGDGEASASYSDTQSRRTDSVGFDAGNNLGDDTSLKGKAELGQGVHTKTVKATGKRTGNESEGTETEGTDPGSTYETGVDASTGYDVAKVSTEVSGSHKNGRAEGTAKLAGTAAVGASAKASAKGTYDTATGDGSASAELGGFAGGTAEGTATATIKVDDRALATFKGTLGISYGIGGEAKGTISWTGGVFRFITSGKLALGLGTSYSYNLELDTAQLAGLAVETAGSYLAPDFSNLEIDFS
ncbi:MAG: hypothetical protein JWN67_3803 [Actinomycetia bacterium]|nr:hypothetical protein [Actinomycetes bacterium]